MHVDQILLMLLGRLSIKQHKFVLSWAAVNLWQEKAFKLMFNNKLITSISKATNIKCQGCEKNCAVDVVARRYPNSTRYYAVCDDPFMHEQMGRMTIPPEQLQQWKISIKQLAVLIANLLGLSNDISYKADQKRIVLGLLKSKALGRKGVVLNVEPLSLLVNQSVLPINELLYFEGDKLALDRDKIDYALNLKKSPQSKMYTPNVGKKEQRKANTLAMYQSWQDEAIKIKKKDPIRSKSKLWVALQIAKMPIAQGRDKETIRKNIQI